MQTRAVELGWVNGVEIAVRSTFSDHPGTLIQEVTDMELRNKVRGLALDRNVAKVTLVGGARPAGRRAGRVQPLADAGINVDMIVQNVGHDGHDRPVVHGPRGRPGRGRSGCSTRVVRELGCAGIDRPTRRVAKVSIVGAGIQQRAGYAARMFGALADAGINIEMISTSEIRITCIIAEDRLDAARRRSTARSAWRPRSRARGGGWGERRLAAHDDDDVAASRSSRRGRVRRCGPRRGS